MNTGTGVDAFRRGLQVDNLARAQSEASDPRSERQAGCMAAGSRAAQHMGGDPACGVLEIRGAETDRRGKNRSVCTEVKQFFPAAGRKANASEAAWRADKELLEREHRALRAAIEKVLDTARGERFLRQIYGVALHDVYHAGQIRLLRRLMSR